MSGGNRLCSASVMRGLGANSKLAPSQNTMRSGNPPRRWRNGTARGGAATPTRLPTTVRLSFAAGRSSIATALRRPASAAHDPRRRADKECSVKIVKIEDLHCGAGWRVNSFLKITTDEGIVGWSEYMEGYGAQGLTGVIRKMAERLIGQDPRPIERHSAYLYAATRQAAGGLNAMAIA